MEFLQSFADWFQTLPPVGIYATLFFVAYVENLVPPFPGDVNVVIGGYLVGLGLIGFVPAVLVVSVGSALGFMTMYAIGKALGDAVEDPARLRWIPKAPMQTAKRWLQRWGYGVVAVNRFLSGTRAVINLLAGASNLKPMLTAFLAFVSSLAWYTLLLYAGYSVGANWESILPILAVYGRVIVGVLMAIACVLVVRWWLRTRKQK
ncbi:MAG: DedA family protein, partial [Bacteroidetes bacterium]|nr:DedA family protein [Bacteroidota bacterium]